LKRLGDKENQVRRRNGDGGRGCTLGIRGKSRCKIIIGAKVWGDGLEGGGKCTVVEGVFKSISIGVNDSAGRWGGKNCTAAELAGQLRKSGTKRSVGPTHH